MTLSKPQKRVLAVVALGLARPNGRELGMAVGPHWKKSIDALIRKELVVFDERKDKWVLTQKGSYSL